MKTFSYTQISHYISCPRRYRYRYVEGWEEKDNHAAAVFGRVFEHALGAYFHRKDSTAAFFEEWAHYREQPLHYPNGSTWDTMAQQAVQLLDRFAQDDRVRIHRPRYNLQVKCTRRLAPDAEFLAYIDAVGQIDGTECLIEWKTAGARYPEAPAGLLSLDPQLIAYCWASGMREAAMVVFVRKRTPEIQYLHTTVSEEEIANYEQLVMGAIRQIDQSHFPAHPGIRFPQNPCLSCSYSGLCLHNPMLTDARLSRRAGAAALDWLDELAG